MTLSTIVAYVCIFVASAIASFLIGRRLSSKPTPTKVERRVPCGVTVIFTDQHGRILMAKRAAKHGTGTWAFPGGWMEHGESFFDTAKREAKEEVDIELHDAEVIDVYDTYFKENDLHCVTVLLLARKWSGTPKVMERDKIDGEWTFFSTDNLPFPLFEPVKQNVISIVDNLNRRKAV